MTIATIWLAQSVLMTAVLTAGAATTASTVAAETGTIQIRLWDQATVTQPEVRLADIASISGQPEDITAIKSFAVSTSLTENQPIDLRAWEIAGRLAKAGFDASQIKLTGAARCRVNFVAPKEETVSTKKNESELVSLEQAVRQAGPATLETKIRELICRNLTEKGLAKEAKVQIDFNPALKELLALTEPPYRFAVGFQERRTMELGLAGVKVRIYRDTDLLQTVPVLAQVKIKAPVIIADRTINSKAKLTAQDIKTTWREITQLQSQMVTDPEAIMDCQAKRMIPPGTVITADMLESIPLVRRNQLVTVIYHKGGLEIKLVGKAMDNGCRNELVKVRNERSKEVFQGRVIGEGKVNVENNSAGEALTGTGLAEGSR
jgi:flagella basal body P-ring formation protein FlgA